MSIEEIPLQAALSLAFTPRRASSSSAMLRASL
jgi:hypothetical protein